MATGLILFIIVGTVVLVGAAAVYVVTRQRRTSEAVERDLEFKRAMVALENKKAKAISARDQFEEYSADRQMQLLRDAYVAGKDRPE